MVVALKNLRKIFFYGALLLSVVVLARESQNTPSIDTASLDSTAVQCFQSRPVEPETVLKWSIDSGEWRYCVASSNP